MRRILTYVGCLCSIYAVLLLNGCKDPEVIKDFGKVVAGKFAEGAASAAVTGFFSASKNQPQPSQQNLLSLKADQSLAADAKIAEIKETINLADQVEAQAYRSLNSDLLNRVYTDRALQLRQTLISNLITNKVYQVETLHGQQFDDFKISSDESIAKVEMTEKWSSELYSTDTNTLVGYFSAYNVPQTVYLQKDSNGWRISAIVFQSDPPEFIQAQPSPSALPQSAVSFNISDNLGVDIGQVSEQITMLIDGKMVGTLAVNQDYPKASLTVTLPSSGKYSFKASARARFNDGVERTCAGEGEVDISDGKSFSVVANSGSNSCFLALQED